MLGVCGLQRHYLPICIDYIHIFILSFLDPALNSVLPMFRMFRLLRPVWSRHGVVRNSGKMCVGFLDALKVYPPLHNVGTQRGAYILLLQHRASIPIFWIPYPNVG